MRKKIKISRVLLIVLYLLIIGYSSGQEKIAISSSVDKSRIKIGDIIKYRAKVIHDKTIEVKMPGMGANLGGFEIRDYEEFNPTKDDDTIISEVEYLISTFTTGKFIIPPLGVQYKEPGDTVYKKLATRKIEIHVESMKPSEEGDIRDIKNPLELPYLWWEVWGKWAALGLGVFIIAVAVFIVYRQKKLGKSIIPKKGPPPRPPHEVALESLDRVKNSKLLKNSDIKKYYTEISEIIRAYFEGRYYISALESTTSEILMELSEIRIDTEVYKLIKYLLINSDMVKFAKVIPGSVANKQILQSAYTIVEKTKVLPLEEQQQDETAESDKGCNDTAVAEEVSEEKNRENMEEVS